MEILVAAKVCLFISETTIYFKPDESVKAIPRFLSLVFRGI